MITEQATPSYSFKILVSKEPENEEEMEGHPVNHSLFFKLKFRSQEEDRIVDLPRIRFIRLEDKTSSPEPWGADRARTWKKASEWIQEIVIDNNPVIQEKRHQNRKKVERAYFHEGEEPDLYKWQEDKEILEEIQPYYSRVKKVLEERIGKPTRSDFAKLYPHKYEDPGLSQRARRAVRDLKAVFGGEIFIKS